MLTLWLCSLATTLGYIGCRVQEHFMIEVSQRCTRIRTGSWLASLLLNALITGFIANIARSHAKSIAFLEMRKPPFTVRVLNMLVASGVLYVLLGIPHLANFANNSRNPVATALSNADQIIDSMLFQLVVSAQIPFSHPELGLA
ncbi:hypothetical protein AURDEDRAFT_166943 [Auricularia subglabra TFB-10046 SS5]|nr:hypothetical protein AURDEDRAFT_166943 [Auricularia subglabra TFB-10046 SS5]